MYCVSYQPGMLSGSDGKIVKDIVPELTDVVLHSARCKAEPQLSCCVSTKLEVSRDTIQTPGYIIR